MTQRRWYGDEPGDPPPPDDTPGIQLVGGPLDGLWVQVSGEDGDPPCPGGLALIANTGMYLGGRSLYDHPDPPDGRLYWAGDVP